MEIEKDGKIPAVAKKMCFIWNYKQKYTQVNGVKSHEESPHSWWCCNKLFLWAQLRRNLWCTIISHFFHSYSHLLILSHSFIHTLSLTLSLTHSLLLSYSLYLSISLSLIVHFSSHFYLFFFRARENIFFSPLFHIYFVCVTWLSTMLDHELSFATAFSFSFLHLSLLFFAIMGKSYFNLK